MSVLNRGFRRVATAGVGVVVAVALVCVPSAFAQGGGTITTAAGVQFNGVVDPPAQLHPADAPYHDQLG